MVFFLVYGFSFYVCDQFRLILEYGLTMQGGKREDVFKGLKLQSLVKKIKSTVVFVHLGIICHFWGGSMLGLCLFTDLFVSHFAQFPFSWHV